MPRAMRHYAVSSISLFVLVTLAGLAACAPTGEVEEDSSDIVESDPDPLQQGWTEKEVSHYEHTSDGSGLFPYKWLIALEQADSKDMFLEDANVRKYGFIPDPKNPDKLPVGLAKQPNVANDEAMVGSTCSSCHEGEITYKGTTLRIHGGQGAADISGLTIAAYDALKETITSPTKFYRFAKRVDGDANVSEFLTAVKKVLTVKLKLFVQERELRGTESTENGPYRADAFGIGVNRLVGPIKKENLRPTKSSASLMYLWGASTKYDWAQYSASSTQPMARNVISALGRGATLSLEPDGKPGLANSVEVKNLYEIETELETLRAPKWPEKLFGAIDQEKAARGKEIYFAKRDGASCASCHSLEKDSRGIYETKVIPLEEIGTDPENAKALDRTVDMDGKLGKGVIPVSEFFELTTQAVLDRKYFEMNASEADVERMNGERPNLYRSSKGYRPRPLDGIWATAPLLHNGSVPNLYQMLLPEGRRVAKFKLGSKEMDPKNVGLVTEGNFTFDTTIEGNRNIGHSGAKFGTELSDDERWDLVEYLKTL